MDVLKYFNRKHRERANAIIAFQNFYQTEQGKDVVKYLLGLTHVMDASFDEDNTHRTAFQEGERNIGLQIVRALGMPMDKLLTIFKEEENTYE